MAALTEQVRTTADELPTRTAPGRAHAALVAAELHRHAGHRDPDAWRAAGRAVEQLDDPYLLSYALMRTAETLATNRSSALDLLDHATGLADRLGAAPLRRAIAAHVRRLRRLAPGSRRDTAHAFTFTERERQIADLVGLGMTNLEIAGRLFVSAKTVEFHLSDIYASLTSGHDSSCVPTSERKPVRRELRSSVVARFCADSCARALFATLISIRPLVTVLYTGRAPG